MSHDVQQAREGSAPNFLAGGGEMGARMRAKDWSDTPLGEPSQWPRSLKTAVRIMLTSRQPIWIGWGPQLVYLYNDAYQTIIGGKHPWALGRPTHEVWNEIWDDIAPLLNTALKGDEGTYVEAQLLIMERSGYPEETYYTFSYSPIPDDNGGAGGIICANTDDTRRVIGERQLALLRELAASMANAHAVAEACECAAAALGTNAHDLPFAMIYLSEPDGRSFSLVGSCGVEPDSPTAPRSVRVDDTAQWPLAETIREHATRIVTEIAGRFGTVPLGAWKLPPQCAALVPIHARGDTGRPGVLVVGLNPYRLLDEDYRRFLDLVASEIGAGIASAQAYEAERRRAEALAEIDRAKTAFFSNVSHEFRTPLALLLGPLEDALNDRSPHALDPLQRQRFEVAHRNALRLLKLVNSLLDFSRIEAGRVQARFQPTNLAVFTSELASSFESATQRAGLKLALDCRPLSEPVYVDREMWEKIVLNLLSNAFKFTLQGGIEVGVCASADGSAAQLRVRDSGTGIPAEELPHLFQRFHRIQNAQGRSFEGSGIGLALVKELVEQHGGSIAVDSEPGQGTTFTVSIPLGKAHLPPDRVAQAQPESVSGSRADAYVQEAWRWLPGESDQSIEAQSTAAEDSGETIGAQRSAGERVLLADDNQDMRDYITRLLEGRGYMVESVADGEAALASARRHKPDLVLTDVMMPRLDGFGLLAALREDPHLRDLPVVLLSARAGEEARVEGLVAGADDYLSKPFSARELLARVGSNLQLAKIRGEVEAELRQVQENLSAALAASDTGTYRWNCDTGELLAVDDNFKRLFGLDPDTPANLTGELGKRVHPEDLPAVQAAANACRQGHADYELEYRVMHPNGEIRWLYSRGKLSLDSSGRHAILVGACTDITARKRQEKHRELLLDELNHRVKNTLAIVQSIAMQTLRGAASNTEARDNLESRLVSLAKAHDVLTAGHWQGGDLKQLVRSSLRAYAQDGHPRFELEGPDLHLRPKALLAVAMALHELATNAVKYGALSNETGQVKIAWQIIEYSKLFQLSWSESGGPVVIPPRRRGFGSRLIEQGLAQDILAHVEMDFAPEGLCCTIEAPLPEIIGTMHEELDVAG